jgi:hypothetical protein
MLLRERSVGSGTNRPRISGTLLGAARRPGSRAIVLGSLGRTICASSVQRQRTRAPGRSPSNDDVAECGCRRDQREALRACAPAVPGAA